LSEGIGGAQVTEGLISVVDDDASVRSATVDLLTSSGFVCEAFESAEAYLQSESSHLTSCLILDVRMAGLNGLELQRVLTDQSRGIRSSLLPPFPTSACAGHAIDGGAICCLPKPYNDEELLGCIPLALERSGRSKRGALAQHLRAFCGRYRHERSGKALLRTIEDALGICEHLGHAGDDAAGVVSMRPLF
jgi:FixJ family two-component response regulator